MLFWSAIFPRFPAFGLNTEKCGKNADQNNFDNVKAKELGFNSGSNNSKNIITYEINSVIENVETSQHVEYL